MLIKVRLKNTFKRHLHTVFSVSLPSRRDISHKLSNRLERSPFVRSLVHRTYTCKNKKKIEMLCLFQMTRNQPSNSFSSTHFFCVSPAFTRIRRTSKTALAGLVFQVIKDFLTLLHKEVQDSDAPSQVSLILRRSPMSSSVNTKNVFVWFRPMESAL